MRKKAKYLCRECGLQSARWLGRCPSCGTWNSLIEEVINSHKNLNSSPEEIELPCPITEVSLQGEDRFPTGIDEVDRVFGGGLVWDRWFAQWRSWDWQVNPAAANISIA